MVLTNRDGSSFGKDGLFLKEFKLIHRIDIQKPAPTPQLFFLENQGKWWLPDEQQALVIQLAKAQPISFVLDCKHIGDNRRWGKYYEMSKEKGCSVISFKKKNDVREEKGNEYELFIAIKGALSFHQLGAWVEEKDGWFYHAGTVIGKDVVVGFGAKKADAIRAATKVFRTKAVLFAKKRARITKLIAPFSVPAATAAFAVDALRTKHGLLAAIPNHPEYLPREELVAIKSILLAKDYAFAKHVLFEYLNRLPLTQCNFDPLAEQGWLFVRIIDLLKALSKENLLRKVISAKEVKQIHASLTKMINEMFAEHRKDGLIVSRANATYQNRSGVRIDVNALTLAMLRTVHILTGVQDGRELALKSAVRQAFLRKTLADTPGGIPRATLFLAAYVYPNLLSKAEWITCIDVALKSLWKPWGGIAWENNMLSYFWLNHVAAIVMHRMDKERYKKHVDTIVQASTTIQRWNEGFVPEQSNERLTKGPASLMANATLLELLQERLS